VSPRLLVLGGSSFVGCALVDEGLARGWDVTTFNRGRSPAPPGVARVVGDRLVPASLAPLADAHWDVIADTWAGAPRAVRDSAALLVARAERYVLVSSCSVYAPPPPAGGDEAAPVVDGSPDAEGGDYPACKRGGELAAEAAFGDRALLARTGLILGPREDVGRLPWWLRRLASGGEVLAPGPPDLPLKFVDARDLARFVLDAALAGQGGPVNVVSRRGHATMRSLLEACRAVAGAPDAQLVWVDPEVVLAAGVEPWDELPAWIPPGHPFAGLHAIGVERAHALGLRCRPVEETVADTWSWLRALPGPPPLRADLPPPGLDRARERQVLAAWRARAADGTLGP